MLCSPLARRGSRAPLRWDGSDNFAEDISPCVERGGQGRSGPRPVMGLCLTFAAVAAVEAAVAVVDVLP